MKQRVIKAADYLKTRAGEHRLQAMVLAYLAVSASPDVYVFAIPNAAKRTPMLAARMKAEGLRAGVADLCVMLPGGKAAWLELKDGAGKQSAAQKNFEEICDRLGHDYAVARNLNDAIIFLKDWGALK